MATAYIAEYESLTQDRHGRVVQVGAEPAVAVQAISVGAKTSSSAFNARTRFVQITTDTACLVAFGTAPDADTPSHYLAAGVGPFFGVQVDRGATTLKVSIKAAA